MRAWRAMALAFKLVFAQFDREGDGEISVAELGTMLWNLGYNCSF